MLHKDLTVSLMDSYDILGNLWQDFNFFHLFPKIQVLANAFIWLRVAMPRGTLHVKPPVNLFFGWRDCTHHKEKLGLLGSGQAIQSEITTKHRARLLGKTIPEIYEHCEQLLCLKVCSCLQEK